jgi:acetyl esterase/lipase
MCDFSQYGGPSEEWLAVEKSLPPISIDMNTEPLAFKQAANAMREDFSAKAMETYKLADKVHTADYTIPTRDGSSIRARTYRSIAHASGKTLPVYLYFHGGGFIVGTLDSENATCSAVAIKVPILVLNVEYRHTPEHIYPTAWHDAQDALAWLHANASTLNVDPRKIIVGGVSAGGQLAASLALEKHLHKAPGLEGLPEILGQVLIIPCTAHPSTYSTVTDKLSSPEVSSYVENENAPLLPVKTIQFFTHYLKPSYPVDPADTKLNIVNATTEQVKGLPPAVFGIAGLDPLRDEGLLYAKLLSDAGVQTSVRLFKGVPHGARRFGEQLPVSSREWDRCVTEGVEWLLEGAKGKGGFNVEVVGG